MRSRGLLSTLGGFVLGVTRKLALRSQHSGTTTELRKETPPSRPRVRRGPKRINKLEGLAVLGSISLAVYLLVTATPTDSPPATAPYRPFTASSYWNTPLPKDAPVDPLSPEIINFLRATNTTDYISLSGATAHGTWGRPIYWAEDGDPTYRVRSPHPAETECGCAQVLPRQFANLRIPKGAQPDINAATGMVSGDGAMTVFDLENGYVAGLFEALYDSRTDTWSAAGGSIHYLDSNGLDGSWDRFADSDPRNEGHRGVPASVMAIRLDEIQAGGIDHVLEMFVNETRRSAAVFPMLGGEDKGPKSSDHPYAPPEGTRIRIKPSVNLDALALSPGARVIAESLQRYGAVIGDMSGGPASIKLEHTLAEGRGDLWAGVLTADALESIPLGSFEVIELGFQPPR